MRCAIKNICILLICWFLAQCYYSFSLEPGGIVSRAQLIAQLQGQIERLHRKKYMYNLASIIVVSAAKISKLLPINNFVLPSLGALLVLLTQAHECNVQIHDFTRRVWILQHHDL